MANFLTPVNLRFQNHAAPKQPLPFPPLATNNPRSPTLHCAQRPTGVAADPRFQTSHLEGHRRRRRIVPRGPPSRRQAAAPAG
eukprot:232484-Chlamydomonas_euryale.AAC.3